MISDGLLRQMVDAMPTPVFVVDDDDRYVYLNRAFELLFQVRAEHVIGRRPDAAGERSVKVLRPSVPSCPTSLAETTAFSLPDGRRLLMGVVRAGGSSAARAELQRTRADLHAAEVELARREDTDPVTQCLSQKTLRTHTDAVIAGEQSGVVRMKLVELDAVARDLGPDVADQLLASFSEIVRGVIRPGDLFARVSEDEFTVVLRGVDREMTSSVARRICSAAVDLGLEAGGEAACVSVSVGAAFSDDDDAALSAIVDQASAALGRAARNEAVVV